MMSRVVSMSEATVLYHKKENIAQITLNRPQADNAINEQLVWELSEVCQKVNQDEDIRVVVVTGAGNKFFSSGTDPEILARIPSFTPAELAAFKARFSVARAISSLELPVIAAINGDALGQGLELALSCDLRFASEKAHFAFPEVALGHIPLDGGTQLLPRIVGRGKALELLFTAQFIDAPEALRIGMVTQVLPPESLLPKAEEMAKKLAAKAPLALRYVREAVKKGLDLTLEQGMRLEMDLYLLLHTTEDRTEGIKAFLEKRTPQFKGR